MWNWFKTKRRAAVPAEDADTHLPEALPLRDQRTNAFADAILAPEGAPEMTGSLVNLSVNGACIRSPNTRGSQLRVGDTVSLRVPMKSLTKEAAIVWKNDWHVGLQFNVYMPANDTGPV